jgi:hypothetical protein
MLGVVREADHREAPIPETAAERPPAPQPRASDASAGLSLSRLAHPRTPEDRLTPVLAQTQRRRLLQREKIDRRTVSL